MEIFSEAMYDEGLGALPLDLVASLCDEDEAPAAAAAPVSLPVPVRAASSDSGVQQTTEGLLQFASMMMEAQGPRPTFEDFARVPSANPFGAEHDNNSEPKTTEESKRHT